VNRETLFAEAMQFFYKEGVRNITEQKIIDQFNLTEKAFTEHFRDKEDFLRQAVDYDLEEKKKQDADIHLVATNLVEEIILLFRLYTKQLFNINSGYFVQIQHLYPQIWRTYTRHTQMHGYYQFYDLINLGIQQGFFHRSINIEIVTKAMIEQINVMHNTHLFPKHRYNMGEVFRSIFLYYLKGICTEKGRHLADQVFAQLVFEE